MRQIIRPGVELPETTVAELNGMDLVKRSSRQVFALKRAILIGVPAAFSPICSRIHLPGFVAQASALLASGFDMIACLAANDPWALAAWGKAVDPDGRIRFLSDGNLEFGQMCCLTTAGDEHFLGTRLKRFSMILSNCVVERFAVESDPLEVSCSGADQFCSW